MNIFYEVRFLKRWHKLNGRIQFITTVQYPYKYRAAKGAFGKSVTYEQYDKQLIQLLETKI